MGCPEVSRRKGSPSLVLKVATSASKAEDVLSALLCDHLDDFLWKAGNLVAFDFRHDGHFHDDFEIG